MNSRILPQAEPFTLDLVAPGPETRGRVSSVESCGTVDGPGIRYVIFTAGCPLQCVYCHNPETRLPGCAKLRTAGDCTKQVLRLKNFLKSGGLTISGGEPLSQPEFVHAIFHEAHAAGIHTALDTSGELGDRASDALLADVDLVLLDIKSALPETYSKVTGGQVDRPLAFARRLSAMGKPVWLRFVLVPGWTDARENLESLADFAAELTNVERLEILPFHKLGEPKYEELGMEYQLKDTPVPSEAQVQAAREIFESRGLPVA